MFNDPDKLSAAPAAADEVPPAGDRRDPAVGAPRRSRAGSLASATRRAHKLRGDACKFWRVFDASMVPMVMVDHRRRHVAANGAARLFARLSLAELLARQIDDLTPPDRHEVLRAAWERLISRGSVGGLYDVCFKDGSIQRVSYCAIANVLPGQHLIVSMPAHWDDDELGTTSHAPEAPSGSLSHRELDVLTLIAGGAASHEIAKTLHISTFTVNTHVRNIHAKLNARNRPQAVALAMTRGLVDPAALETNICAPSAA